MSLRNKSSIRPGTFDDSEMTRDAFRLDDCEKAMQEVANTTVLVKIKALRDKKGTTALPVPRSLAARKRTVKSSAHKRVASRGSKTGRESPLTRSAKKAGVSTKASPKGVPLKDRLPPDLKLLPGKQKVPLISFARPKSIKARARCATPKEPETQVGRPNHVKTCRCPPCRKAQRLRLSAPITLKYKGGLRLIESTMESNFFRRTGGDNWNLLWVSQSIKPHIYQTLSRYQKVNQFPRSYEITRKDQLARNFTRMQQRHGVRHFNYLPRTYVLPEDRDLFDRETSRLRMSTGRSLSAGRHSGDAPSSQLWIVKPAASACGRGIFVTDNIGDIPVGGIDESNVIVSEYISRPLLLDQRKFDLRLYVAVTSFNPLRVYLYEEGLVRLTTQPYSSDLDSLKNRFVHLTNYSVQKNSGDFVQAGEDSENDEKSNKWSLSSFRARMAAMGHDCEALFSHIEQVIVKTLISIEPQVALAMEMHSRHDSNSFQLFGFDVLIDEALKPWLIEVNLGPSLSCDSPLDFDIKSAMITELLTLAGVPACDIEQEMNAEAFPSHARPASRGDLGPSELEPSRVEIARGLRQLREEQARSGGWDCIYPTTESFVYSRFFDRRGINQALVDELSSHRSISEKSRAAKALLQRNV